MGKATAVGRDRREHTIRSIQKDKNIVSFHNRGGGKGHACKAAGLHSGKKMQEISLFFLFLVKSLYLTFFGGYFVATLPREQSPRSSIPTHTLVIPVAPPLATEGADGPSYQASALVMLAHPWQL